MTSDMLVQKILSDNYLTAKLCSLVTDCKFICSFRRVQVEHGAESGDAEVLSLKPGNGTGYYFTSSILKLVRSLILYVVTVIVEITISLLLVVASWAENKILDFRAILTSCYLFHLKATSFYPSK